MAGIATFDRLGTLAAVLLLPACVEELSIENAGDRWAEAACDQAARCEATPSPREECLASQRGWMGFEDLGGRPTSLGTFRAILDSARSGAVRVDLKALQACLDRTREASCAASSGLVAISTAFPVSDNLCPEAFAGTLPAGARCITDAACSLRHGCKAEWNSCDGLCTALPADECRVTADCDGGEICWYFKCRATSPAGGRGEPCGFPTACEAGLACERIGELDSDTLGFRCEPIPAGGEPCKRACETGFVCDSEGSRTCLRIAEEGDACESSVQCPWPTGCHPERKRCETAASTGPCADWARVGCDPRVSYCEVSDAARECRPHAVSGATCPVGNECGSGLLCRGPDEPNSRRCEAPEPYVPAPRVVCAP